ncbi:MAG: hypothetical protein JNJ83_08845 [Verrucomicrobiaceae bacterium]|nr:hypothetical protein [Verrucomicrobiaceae bacterium]
MRSSNAWAGEAKEADTPNFLHEGFRERDIDTGLFLTPDPMEFIDGTNTYAYVKHNPFSSFDPYGLYSFDWGGFGAGLANFAMGAVVGIAVAAVLVATLPAAALTVVAVGAAALAVGVAAKQGIEAVSGKSDWGTGSDLSDYERTKLGTEAVLTAVTLGFAAGKAIKARGPRGKPKPPNPKPTGPDWNQPSSVHDAKSIADDPFMKSAWDDVVGAARKSARDNPVKRHDRDPSDVKAAKRAYRYVRGKWRDMMEERGYEVPKDTELDHYYPQNSHPEGALFPENLKPAPNNNIHQAWHNERGAYGTDRFDIGPGGGPVPTPPWQQMGPPALPPVLPPPVSPPGIGVPPVIPVIDLDLPVVVDNPGSGY